MATSSPLRPKTPFYRIPKPLANFSLLLKLPLEMQVRIYETAIDTIPARNINIQPSARGSFVPTILHLNHFTRSLGLKYYSRFIVSSRKYGRKFAILIRLEKDTIVLGDSKVFPNLPGSMYGLMGFEDLAIPFTLLFTQIKRLTIYQKVFQIVSGGVHNMLFGIFLGPPETSLREVLAMCPEVMELTVVLDASKGVMGAHPFSVDAIDPFRYIARFKQELRIFRTKNKPSETESGIPLPESDLEKEEECDVGFGDMEPEEWKLRVSFMVENDLNKPGIIYSLPIHLYI